MKALLALCLAPLLAAPTVPIQTGPGTPYFAGMPPERFIREVAVMALFVAPSRIEDLCGPPPEGMVVMACVRRLEGVEVVIMPHPIVAHGEVYADLLTHELAHVAGWSREHEL